MNKNVCVYHKGDLDGHSSGAIVRQGAADPEILMIPMEYGDPIPWDKLEGAGTVYVVDFNLEPLETNMPKLSEMVDEVVWIDHHKSAIDAAESIGYNPPGIRRVGQAACELAWEYFYRGSVKIPQAVWLLGRYDVWDHAASEDVMPFQLGMQAQPHTSPMDPASEDFWLEAFLSTESFLGDRVNEGHTIGRFRQSLFKLYQQHAHEITFEDENWIAINTQKIGSQAFEGVFDPDKHHGCISYFRGGSGKWVISLYDPTQTKDLSVIAKKYGGGGHPAACGFTIHDTRGLEHFLNGYYKP